MSVQNSMFDITSRKRRSYQFLGLEIDIYIPMYGVFYIVANKKRQKISDIQQNMMT